MIDENHPRLSLVRQCALVEISRSSWYYRPVGESQANVRLMRRMDELHLSCPWYGSRQMARALRRMGHRVGRKRVRRLMRAMGLRSLAPRPNTSRRAPGHRVYPYLLRDLAVDRPNQVWCADLTYLPMARGFLYLVAIMDWYSRKVLSWGLSTTQDTVFCVHALLDDSTELSALGNLIALLRIDLAGNPLAHTHGLRRLTALLCVRLGSCVLPRLSPAQSSALAPTQYANRGLGTIGMSFTLANEKSE